MTDLSNEFQTAANTVITWLNQIMQDQHRTLEKKGSELFLVGTGETRENVDGFIHKVLGDLRQSTSYTEDVRKVIAQHFFPTQP